MAVVDLRYKFGPIEQQGIPNSCVAHAVTSALEAILNRTDLSRLFVYYNARAFANQTHGDFGCSPRNAMKSISQFGVPPEAAWKYETSKITVKPSAAAYSEALVIKPRIKAYQSVQTFASMKLALIQGLPVVFGLTVPDTFASKTKYDGILPMWSSSTRWIGGHCVVAVGFNDATRMVSVRNSFGTAFGRGGYFDMPYEWFTDIATGKISDCWTFIPTVF